jgi:hypothetical protein
MHAGPKIWRQDFAEELNSLTACCFGIKVQKTLFNVIEGDAAIQYARKEVEDVEERVFRV